MNLLRRRTGPAGFDNLGPRDATPAGKAPRGAGSDAVGLIVCAIALAGLALALGASVGMMVEADGAPPASADTAPR